MNMTTRVTALHPIMNPGLLDGNQTHAHKAQWPEPNH